MYRLLCLILLCAVVGCGKPLTKIDASTPDLGGETTKKAALELTGEQSKREFWAAIGLLIDRHIEESVASFDAGKEPPNPLHEVHGMTAPEVVAYVKRTLRDDEKFDPASVDLDKVGGGIYRE